MSILSKLFGNNGKIRFEGITEKNNTFSGKTRIESFGMSKKELEEELKRVFFVETGERAKEINITGFYPA